MSTIIRKPPSKIKHCVLREDPKDRWKKSMPKKPTAGSIEERVKCNKDYRKKHGVNLK